MPHVLMIETAFENIPIGVFYQFNLMVKKANELTPERIEQLTDEFFKATNRERGMQEAIHLVSVRVGDGGDIGFPGLLNETHRVIREIMFTYEDEENEGICNPGTE